MVDVVLMGIVWRQLFDVILPVHWDRFTLESARLGRAFATCCQLVFRFTYFTWPGETDWKESWENPIL